MRYVLIVTLYSVDITNCTKTLEESHWQKCCFISMGCLIRILKQKCVGRGQGVYRKLCQIILGPHVPSILYTTHLVLRMHQHKARPGSSFWGFRIVGVDKSSQIVFLLEKMLSCWKFITCWARGSIFGLHYDKVYLCLSVSWVTVSKSISIPQTNTTDIVPITSH